LGKDDPVSIVALYCRVSSQEQQRRGTIESQRRVLGELARALGHEVFAVYEDDGRSAKTGALGAREAWARLMVDAEARRFELVMVVDVDRLSRTEDQIERAAIFGPLQRLGINIITPQGQFDAGTLMGDLLIGIYAAMAAEERRKLLTRTNAGRRTTILRGGNGAGPTPFGLRYTKLDGWQVVEPAAECVRQIVRRLGNGEACHQIADRLNEQGLRPERTDTWTQYTVWHVIRHARTRYAGTWVQRKRDGLATPVPRIVTDEEIEAADLALVNHKRRGLEHRTTAVYLLDRRLLQCGTCGDTFGAKTAKPGEAHATYVCWNRHLIKKGDPGRCDQPIYRVRDVDDALWSEISALVASDDFVRLWFQRRHKPSTPSRSADRWLAKAQAEVDRLDRVEAVLVDQGVSGAIPEDVLARRLASLGPARAKAQAALAEAKAASGKGRPSVAQVSDEQIEATVTALRARIARADASERRKVTRMLVGEAVLDGGVLSLGLNLPGEAVSCSRLHRNEGRLRVLVPHPPVRRAV
jgi:DNA invertase Pin-like site-specific DNA recombinase